MDIWSRSVAMLVQPAEPAVKWPAERCRRISMWPHSPPPNELATSAKGELVASDAAVLQTLRTQNLETTDLARHFRTSRQAMAARLVRLHGLGLVISQADDTWRSVR
jgi:hypothetical protein